MQLRALAACAAAICALSGCATAVDDIYTLPTKYRTGTTAPVTDTGTKDTEPADTAPADDTGTPDDTGVPDTDYADTDPRTDTGVVDDSGDGCTTCVNTSCTGEISSCMADKSCTDEMDCLSACPDDACAASCQTTYASASFDGLMSCIGTRCAVECGAY